jgi:hypothetical protein
MPPDQINSAIGVAPGEGATSARPKEIVPSAQTPSPSTSPWLAALAELFGGLPFIGKFFKSLIEKRLWGPLLLAVALLFFFIIYPLLVVFLAALWMNTGILLGAKNLYVEEVRSAFRVREAADDATAESHKRLDYFIPIEFSRPARDSKTIEIPLAPLQRIEVRILSGRLLSTDPTLCAVPDHLLGEGSELMEVLLNDVSIGRVENSGEQKFLQPTRQAWSQITGLEGNNSMRLSFRPRDELRAACQKLQVDVRASVLVFKEVYKP